MATVKERFEKLGIELNPSMLSGAGAWVSTAFVERNLHPRVIQEQTEETGTFKVWSYPESWSVEMDKIITSFVNAPTKAPIERKAPELPDGFAERKKRPRIPSKLIPKLPADEMDELDNCVL